MARGAATLCLIITLAWGSCAVWNSVKPLPRGTRVASLPARLDESQVDFLDDLAPPGALLKRETEAIGRAEQTIVLNQSPLARELADALLLRKRQRPNLKIMLVTDPRNEVYGGTPSRTLSALERTGIVVVRTRLERLRDPNPLYSSLWRLCVGWWSDPFDETPGKATLRSSLRRRNLKADGRQLLVADDGAGGWTSIVMSAASTGAAASIGGAVSAGLGVEIRGHLAAAIVASELQLAAWSTDDDRLPAAPPADSRGVGTIDARFLTEGAIQAALRDAIAIAGSGDSIKIAVQAFGDRKMVDAVVRAAARGARVQLLLDPGSPETQAAAGELLREEPGSIEVRWRARDSRAEAGYAVIQHRSDVWFDVGSANFTRRALDDLDLAADIELHMPARAGPARAVTDLFAKHWSNAAAYASHADESTETYWRYRVAEATGLSVF
ncbi:MAG TPA: phospholipase D-like domain-containing protein [Steroidobacteraceae bacterium]|nr:phospholipase D-like domain-containing protein [Steroidobacteraceae bacterium]